MTAFLKAGGVPPIDSVTSAMLKDNSVTAAKIPDGAVTAAKTTGLPADKDIRALALEVADVKGAALNFPNGGADAFDSDTLATKQTPSMTLLTIITTTQMPQTSYRMTARHGVPRLLSTFPVLLTSTQKT